MQCQSKTKLPILLPIFCQPITNLQCNANSDQTAQFLANRSIHHQSSTDPLPIYLWPVNSMTIKLVTNWQSRISTFNPSVNLFPILCQSYNWNSQSCANQRYGHFATLDNMQYQFFTALPSHYYRRPPSTEDDSTNTTNFQLILHTPQQPTNLSIKHRHL